VRSFFVFFFGVRSFGVATEDEGGGFFPEFGDGTRVVFGGEFSGDMAREEAGTARIPLRIIEEELLP
jgi:hypothetical protein